MKVNDMKKYYRYLIAAAVFAAVFFLRVPLKQTQTVENNYQKAEIIRVVDGDTLVVKMDGEQVRVRLIGVDCEESTMEDEKMNTEKGRAEADYVRQLLPQNTVVYLQKDQSETDVYGRLLRYVWLEIPQRPWDVNEVSQKMLNGILIEKMHTRVKEYPPDVRYLELFRELEETGM